MQTTLVTGAAGNMGAMLRAARPEGMRLRLVDRAAQLPAQPTEQVEVITASITDPAVLADACRGVDAVVHLAGISNEASWAEVFTANVEGTRALLDAARDAGVRRFIVASSHHAAGLWQRPPSATPLPADVRGRPDSFYGLTKVVVESLAELYCQRYDLDVFCLRIGHCFPSPRTAHALAIWLSPADWVRLVDACLTSTVGGFRLIWGVSANTRGWLSLREGREIGYHPRDDSEVHATALLAGLADPGGTHGRTAGNGATADDPLGGSLTGIPLGISPDGWLREQAAADRG